MGSIRYTNEQIPVSNELRQSKFQKRTKPPRLTSIAGFSSNNLTIESAPDTQEIYNGV